MRFIPTTTRMLSIPTSISFAGKLWRRGRGVNCKSTRKVSLEARFLNLNCEKTCLEAILAMKLGIGRKTLAIRGHRTPLNTSPDGCAAKRPPDASCYILWSCVAIATSHSQMGKARNPPNARLMPVAANPNGCPKGHARPPRCHSPHAAALLQTRHPPR